jgi:hypothetical protein
MDTSDFLGIIIFIVAAIIFVLFSCSGMLVDNHVAIKALETQGFQNITITDKDWLFVPFKGGDRSDVAKFTATAINPAKDTVTVCVYAGWPFKGGTIRTC